MVVTFHKCKISFDMIVLKFYLNRNKKECIKEKHVESVYRVNV